VNKIYNDVVNILTKYTPDAYVYKDTPSNNQNLIYLLESKYNHCCWKNISGNIKSITFN